MMESSTNTAVLYEKEGPIAWITLNRPEAVNAVNQEVRELLPRYLFQAEADPEVRVLVLCGAGPRGFCAGADLKDFGREQSPVEMRASRRHEHWIDAFERVSKPVVAAVHGYCLGGGLEIALASDLRIAADDAQLGLPEVTRGTIPGAGGTQRLSRIVGVGRALDMILTGERISAEEAHRIGLVSRVCPAGELRTVAAGVATRIAENAPVSVRYAKEAVIKGFDLPLEDGRALELDLATLLLTTEDRREAGQAFREKRKPQFKGR